MKGLPPDTDCYRLIDRPDHTVDVFGPVAILSLYRASTPEEERALAGAIDGVRTVYVKRRPVLAQGQKTEDSAPAWPLRG